MRYFHGGPRGLAPGDLIRSPHEERVETMRSTAQMQGAVVQDAARELLLHDAHVTFNTDRKVARLIASINPGGGALYQVEPDGDVVQDDVMPTLAWRAFRCTVVAVYDAMVPYDPNAYDKLRRIVVAPDGVMPPADLERERTEAWKRTMDRLNQKALYGR